MMKFVLTWAVFGASLVASAAPIKVVTSTTDLAWAAKEIAGPYAEVKALLKGSENPHFVDAVPEFIRLAAEASVAVVIGLDLEIGWMPKVLARSGNSQIQPGGKGYCEVGRLVAVLERPTGPVNRSMGDVHPSGNPHFWLSPKHLAMASRAIFETLVAVDPAHYSEYDANQKKLATRLEQVATVMKARLDKTFAGTSPLVIEYHKEFAYFLETYGLRSLGSVEEKPGVPPSAGRLADIAQTAKSANVRFVLAGDTAPRKTLDRFRELSGVPSVIVPLSLKPSDGLADYEKHQALLIDAVIGALSPGKG